MAYVTSVEVSGPEPEPGACIRVSARVSAWVCGGLYHVCCNRVDGRLRYLLYEVEHTGVDDGTTRARYVLKVGKRANATGRPWFP